MNRIKKILEKAKGKWVEKLSNILWAYRTTLRKATNKIPYALAFRFKVVILLEVGLPQYGQRHMTSIIMSKF